MKKTVSIVVSVVGGVMALIGLLVLVFCAIGMYASEEEMDRNRERYAQSQEANEQLTAEYEADTVRTARYQEFLDAFDRANEAGDSLLMEQLQDSIAEYGPPELISEGSIGFNIAGALLIIPAAVGLVLLVVGAVLLVVGRVKNEE